jgi:phenylpropionate dioxygenase-like ring-hydroxylating dioxygenase large terminal subunit
MFMNFWYPVVRAVDLGATPQKVRILAHDFVVFRDEQGKPAVLSDTCIHRGASLSAGKCKEDGSVQCPYHGWRFNREGVCTRIPSIGSKTKPPPRARVDAYPVQEQYGIVFAFLGDLPEAERPPIMPVPEHGTDEWRSTLVTFDVDYHYERSIENGLDPAHNEYVHTTHGYQGEREDTYLMMELRPHQDNAWGHGFLSTFDAPPLKNPVMRQFRKEGGKMEAGSGTYGPNHMWTYIHFTAKTAMHQYMFEAPIDENRTRVFLLNQRNIGFFKVVYVNFFRKIARFVVDRFRRRPDADAAAPVTAREPEPTPLDRWLSKTSRMGPIGRLIKRRLNLWLDKKINERNMFIASQDITVMNNVRPRLTPPSRAKELMMPADRVILQYRDKLDEFESRGWRIDMAALRAAKAKGDVIFAIPCPARRETNAWVLDEVPRVAPSPAAPTLQAVGGG